MKIQTQALIQRIPFSGILIDLSALSFIYLVPTLSHLLSLPVYLIEPMRLMLILALVHTSKQNGYLLALTMPLFSFIISGHPVFAKMILIAAELSLNVFLFYLFSNRMKYLFPAVFLSILLSKAIYYLLKFALIQLAVINSGLVATPLLMQLGMTVVFSSYLALFYKKVTRDR
jgi:hypothetical protein